MALLSEERTPQQWEDEFEDITDDPAQNPIQFYTDDSGLGPAVPFDSLREAVEEWKRQREERMRDE